MLFRSLYCYPERITDELIDVIAKEPKIVKYLDIPIQHCNAEVLKNMRRKCDADMLRTLFAKLRSRIPGITLRTTLLVGFPGETNAQFDELAEFIQEMRFDRMGCFAYSQEEDTPAEKLGDTVSEEEKERRVSELMAVQEQISLAKNQARIGHNYRVLIDRLEGDNYIARTEYDSPDIDNEVLIPNDTPLKIGEFYQVRITQALEHDLIAQLV